MSTPIFNAKINLTGANSITADTFQFQFTVSDALGIFSGLDVEVNDLVFIDTSGSLIGTITRYRVMEINSKSYGSVDVNVMFDDNNPLANIDPGSAIFLDGFVCRPTPTNQYSIVPDPDTQILPNNFSIAPRNSDFWDRLDSISTGAKSVSLSNLGASTVQTGQVVISLENGVQLVDKSDNEISDGSIYYVAAEPVDSGQTGLFWPKYNEVSGYSGFTVNTPVFLGSEGQVTQNPIFDPGDAVVLLGTAKTAQSFELDPRLIIIY